MTYNVFSGTLNPTHFTSPTSTIPPLFFYGPDALPAAQPTVSKHYFTTWLYVAVNFTLLMALLSNILSIR